MILFLLPNVSGGVRSYIHNLVWTLAEQDVECRSVSYSFENCWSHHKQIDEYGNMKVVLSNYAPVASRYRFLASIFRASDILVCNDSFELEAINYMKCPHKVIFVLHGDLGHYRNTLFRYHTFIDQVVCVSKGLKAKYGPLYPEVPFVVSTPFVMEHGLSRSSKSERLRCFFAGRFEYLKGADLFLSLVRETGDRFEWTVVCPSVGNEQELLDQLPPFVDVLHDLSNKQLLDLMSQQDVLIFPSRSEGFGMVILESMTCGVVPVVLDIPIGIPDQVQDGFNGFIIREEDWNNAAGLIKRLAVDPVLLDNTGASARSFAQENFHPVAIGKNFIHHITQAAVRGHKDYFQEQSGGITRLLPEFVYKGLKKIRSSFSHSE